MPLHVATHPLISHKMTVLRDVKTGAADFRKLLKEITFYLGYEASRDLKLTSEPIRTPMNVDFSGSKIGEQIAIIPILRAGLAMSDGMLDLMPKAAVYHIGRSCHCIKIRGLIVFLQECTVPRSLFCPSSTTIDYRRTRSAMLPTLLILASPLAILSTPLFLF